MLPLELQYLYMHSIAVPAHGLVFSKNSKAGCTSIAHSLRQAICDQPIGGRIHEDNHVLFQGYSCWPTARRSFRSADTFKFTTIRHPLKRMKSAFLDIFVEKRNLASVNHREAIEFVRGRDCDSLAVCFSRFVDYVQANIELLGVEADRHWRPQVQNIAIDHICYDKIGRIEEVRRWLPEVFEATGLSKNAAAHKLQKFNASNTAEFRVCRNDVRRVEELFRRDHDLWEGSGN